MNGPEPRTKIVVAIATALLLLARTTVSSAADPFLDTQTAQSLQDEKLKNFRHEDQIRRLNRDQQLSQFRRQLDEKKRHPVVDFQPHQQFEMDRLQRQLDDIKSDQQLKQVQTAIRLDQINREQNLLRRQEGIRELQRQQQFDFVLDQQRKLQIGHELDGLRNQQPFR